MGASSDPLRPGRTPTFADGGWFPLLPPTVLQPDTRHRFVLGGLPADRPDVAWLRLDVRLDAGLSRVRLHGTPTQAGHAALRAAWTAADSTSVSDIA